MLQGGEGAGAISSSGSRRCKKDGARITEIAMENGNMFRAKMFIDSTYEGDLMAKAGVSYHVGREAESRLRRDAERHPREDAQASVHGARSIPT